MLFVGNKIDISAIRSSSQIVYRCEISRAQKVWKETGCKNEYLMKVAKL